MSGQARKARLDFNMAKAVGIDDMAGTLDFRKKVDDYNEAVARAQAKAKKKSGFLSFLGTLVTAAVAFTNPFGFASLIAQGGMAALSGTVARVIGDQSFGDLKAPTAPQLKSTKYRKLKRQEQQQTLTEGYDQLKTDLDQIEDDIDMGHLIEPFTQALTYFGPQVIAQNAEMATQIADTTNNINSSADFKASIPDPGGVNWATLGGIGLAAGAGIVAMDGETDGMGSSSSANISDDDDSESEDDVVDWDTVYANLGFDPSSGNEGAMPTTPGGVSYSQRIDDLDYLEDLTDGDA
tara:strand:+ start:22938 stop:23819 length:882 start_codon:yes stop_codon:yes gene_type:complete